MLRAWPILKPILHHPYALLVNGQGTASQQSASSASQVVTLPADYKAGDMLLVMMATAGVVTVSAAGWTVDVNGFSMSAGGAISLLHKTADGTEGASVTVTASVATTSANVAAAVRGWRKNYPSGADLGVIDAASVNPGGLFFTTAQIDPFLWITFWGAKVTATTTPTAGAHYGNYQVNSTIANSVQGAAGHRYRFTTREVADSWVETGGTVTGRASMLIAIRGNSALR